MIKRGSPRTVIGSGVGRYSPMATAISFQLIKSNTSLGVCRGATPFESLTTVVCSGVLGVKTDQPVILGDAVLTVRGSISLQLPQ